MGEKRFRTRRQWHNTLLVVWLSPFLILSGVFVAMATGNFWPLTVLLAFTLLTLLLGLRRDMAVSGTYTITGDTLLLESAKERLEVVAATIMDASLVDRAAARDYIRIRAARSGKDKDDQRAMEDAFLRFCTVDIGLRSLTFGLGRGMIDRMPNAKHDMVLLRMREGSDLLLSPEYNQEMVDHIVRMLRRRDDGTAPGA